MKQILAIVCSALVIPMMSPGPVRAEVITAGGAPGLCLDWNTSTNNVALWQCHGGANQNFFTASYGQQRSGNMCLDHGPLSDPGNLRGGYLVMAPCNSSKRSQRWVLTDKGDRNPGRLRNEEGSCVNIPGGMGYARQGQALIVWTCQTGFSNGVINDVWSRGRESSLNTSIVPSLLVGQMNAAGRIYAPASAIISRVGSTVVAAGGGNVVSQGGGNVIVTSGGAVVSQGGGNLLSSDGAGLVGPGGSSLVGPGGSSLVNTNGGNAISNNGSSRPTNPLRPN